MSSTVVSRDENQAASASHHPRERAWMGAVGAAAVVASLLPPFETLAQRYVFAETIQFAIFAIVGPALIVLGAPWRWLRLSRRDAAASGPRAAIANSQAGPADRLAEGRRQRPHFRRAGVYLLLFMAVAFVWRLPPVMGALVSAPALVLVEMVSLLVTGIGVWLELAPSPPLAPRLPRPQRATIAALAMWFLWVVSYVVGMDNGAVYRAYDPAGHMLSLMADQEIAAGVMWAIAGFAFVPVVFISMLGWLNGNDSNPEEELQRLVRDEQQRPVVRGWGPPAGRRG